MCFVFLVLVAVLLGRASFSVFANDSDNPFCLSLLHSCPVTDDVIIGDTSWRNETSRVMKLTYNAFAFAGQESSVYFQHCTFRVCSATNKAVSKPGCFRCLQML